MILIKNKVVTRLPVFLFALFYLPFSAQQYGQEWINYGQRYFKFPVYSESLYRIDSSTLAKAFDLTSIDPRNLQVFLRGSEQRIYVHGEADGKFNTGDYLELYAHPGSAVLDSLLYHNISYLPNPYAPMYNDTMYAFVTVSAAPSALRYKQETDTSFSSYPAAPFFYAEKVSALRYYYNKVDEFDQGSSDPRYTQAEGYGAYKQQGQYETPSFAGTPIYTSTPLPVWLTVSYSGNSKNVTVPYDHQIQIAYRDNNSNTVVLSDTLFSGFAAVKRRYQISNTTLSSSSEYSLISVASPSFSGFTNATVPHYFHLFYPGGPNLGSVKGQAMYLDDHVSAGKSGILVYGLALNGSKTVKVYDITNGLRLPGWESGFYIKTLVPNGGGRKKLFMMSDSVTIKVKDLSPAGQNGFFTDYLASAGARPYIMIYNKVLMASATAYRDYRKSAVGGGFDVIYADIAQLYEQYAFGVNKHPAAIVNFLRRSYHELPSKPTNVLLIGSAASPNLYSPSHSLNYVPTMGWPNSDNLLAAGLSTPGQYDFFPQLPIGRIAALNDAEVNVYLNKVKEHEAAGPTPWKKKVLHFVGGDSEFLTTSLSTFMSGYEDVIEDTLYGAEVRTFRKNSTAPIQVVLSDSIKDLINEGAGLLTFFGHGSPYGFDQSIDEPNLYNNAGRYPFLYANSCYSGDIHDPNSVTVSKRFVFAPQKGSVGFLATTSLGFIHPLHNYAGHFYRSLSSLKYNHGIGEVIMEAAKLNATSGHAITNFTGLDMALHGDPAVVISGGMLPDYTLSNNDVRFDPGSHQDSIAINIAYRNIGKAIHDSVIILLDRIFPNNDTASAFRRTKAAFFRDTVQIVMPVGGNDGAGLNYFRVQIDPLDEIGESNENNNTSMGLIEFLIPGNDIIPVYPYQFAVIPRSGSVTLKASTLDPYAAQSAYRFQLDTTDKFHAPVSSTLIVSRGGVLEWPVSLPYKDSTVYYWRVTKDSIDPSHRIAWRESSFQVISDKRGWGQAHFHQFRDNGYRFVTYRDDLRQFVLENRLNTVDARTGFHPYLREEQQTYYFNNNKMDSYSCTFNGWNFAVFDSITGEPQALPNPAWPGGASSGQDGNCLCNRDKLHFVYYFGKTNECGYDLQWQNKVENFLNAVPPNNYVLGYTTGNPSGNAEMSTYSNALYQAFESIGSGDIRNTPDTVPMIIFGRKGMSPGQAHESAGTDRRSILYTQDSIRTKWSSGYIASGLIGPSNKWHSLHWQVSSLETNAGDTSILKVIGVRQDGSLDTLLTLRQDSTDLTGLNGIISAETYPFIKLITYMKDITHRTSPQLRRWHVLFDEAPECAINPQLITATSKDSVQEGEQAVYYFPIENIGATDFTDSLAVSYWIENRDRMMLPLMEKMKAAPFIAGQVLTDTVNIDSYALRGNNALWISVNSPEHPKYQREQYYFNNVARVPFSVGTDVTNPLLDVTFDGRRILNGDLVSAKPAILVTLKDENKFLALNDTSAFTISLRRPDQGSPQRVYFGQGLQFTPASLPKNSASILYTPQLLQDGRYTLLAQAVDRSNNRSGAKDFVIDFEVNNKPTITNVLNYPNPFTTSTRFVFTLTGSEIPDVFTIQILTVTGKVVREITRSELGVLHIGRNITDYAWDGRDQFGDRLANGVYLYKVNTRLNGRAMEKNASGADKFFNREIGKMVLIR